jgi:hypothetical protein
MVRNVGDGRDAMSDERRVGAWMALAGPGFDAPGPYEDDTAAFRAFDYAPSLHAANRIPRRERHGACAPSARATGAVDREPLRDRRGRRGGHARHAEGAADRLLTAEQLATRWQVPKSHVYRLTREGPDPRRPARPLLPLPPRRDRALGDPRRADPGGGPGGMTATRASRDGPAAAPRDAPRRLDAQVGENPSMSRARRRRAPRLRARPCGAAVSDRGDTGARIECRPAPDSASATRRGRGHAPRVRP